MATLTWDQIKQKPKEPQGPAEQAEPSYTCITELQPDPSSVASIVIGEGRVAPRWRYDSTINYATYADGYPNEDGAIYAANALIAAAEEWNAVNVGVAFKWVSNVEDAAFVLQYGGDKGTVLASAFFPNDKPLNTVFVYSYAFDKKQNPDRGRGDFRKYEIMKNVFLHELGHVLGLRHEFALDIGPQYEGSGAVRVFSTDKESVMSYKFPPLMQDSDKQDTRAFYKLPLIQDFVPDN